MIECYLLLGCAEFSMHADCPTYYLKKGPGGFSLPAWKSPCCSVLPPQRAYTPEMNHCPFFAFLVLGAGGSMLPSASSASAFLFFFLSFFGASSGSNTVPSSSVSFCEVPVSTSDG